MSTSLQWGHHWFIYLWPDFLAYILHINHYRMQWKISLHALMALIVGLKTWCMFVGHEKKQIPFRSPPALVNRTRGMYWRQAPSGLQEQSFHLIHLTYSFLKWPKEAEVRERVFLFRAGSSLLRCIMLTLNKSPGDNIHAYQQIVWSNSVHLRNRLILILGI